MSIANPFHNGEIEMQRMVGEEHLARRNGRAISDSIPNGAFKFINSQQFAILGCVDENSYVWAFSWFGAPGFLHAPDGKRLHINTQMIMQKHDNPLNIFSEMPSRIGMLIIEPQTRRRLRINGRLQHHKDKIIELLVEESYPNCPKYIVQREMDITFKVMQADSAMTTTGGELSRSQRGLIHGADTFFVASTNEEKGVDVSHRGGSPGFVEVLDEKKFRIPDYRGNSMYNTLGNFVLNPAAGLLFIDYKNSVTLHLTGTANIITDHDDPHQQTGGTNRWWEFQITKWVQLHWPIIFHAIE